MWTSNFSRRGLDPRAVSIALFPPKWYTGKTYPPLYPPEKLLKDYKEGNIGEYQFIKKYTEQVLSKLDAHKIYDELGDDVIFLCWCGRKKFCHRHIVAQWFTDNGIVTKETL